MKMEVIIDTEIHGKITVKGGFGAVKISVEKQDDAVISLTVSESTDLMNVLKLVTK